MAYFNNADLTPSELEDLAFLRARRAGINEDVEVNSKFSSCFDGHSNIFEADAVFHQDLLVLVDCASYANWRIFAYIVHMA